jgi:hypothetical protein
MKKRSIYFRLKYIISINIFKSRLKLYISDTILRYQVIYIKAAVKAEIKARKESFVRSNTIRKNNSAEAAPNNDERQFIDRAADIPKILPMAVAVLPVSI